jgi:hypothetical protein
MISSLLSESPFRRTPLHARAPPEARAQQQSAPRTAVQWAMPATLPRRAVAPRHTAQPQFVDPPSSPSDAPQTLPRSRHHAPVVTFDNDDDDDDADVDDDRVPYRANSLFNDDDEDDDEDEDDEVLRAPVVRSATRATPSTLPRLRFQPRVPATLPRVARPRDRNDEDNDDDDDGDESSGRVLPPHLREVQERAVVKRRGGKKAKRTAANDDDDDEEAAALSESESGERLVLSDDTSSSESESDDDLSLPRAPSAVTTLSGRQSRPVAPLPSVTPAPRKRVVRDPTKPKPVKKPSTVVYRDDDEPDPRFDDVKGDDDSDEAKPTKKRAAPSIKRMAKALTKAKAKKGKKPVSPSAAIKHRPGTMAHRSGARAAVDQENQEYGGDDALERASQSRPRAPVIDDADIDEDDAAIDSLLPRTRVDTPKRTGTKKQKARRNADDEEDGDGDTGERLAAADAVVLTVDRETADSHVRRNIKHKKRLHATQAAAAKPAPAPKKARAAVAELKAIAKRGKLQRREREEDSDDDGVEKSEEDDDDEEL